MNRNLKKKKIVKLTVVAILSLSLICSTVPAIFLNNLISFNKKIPYIEKTSATLTEKFTMIWEDEFDDDIYISILVRLATEFQKIMLLKMALLKW